ncbi:(2Fe-2S)-binding protein [Brassicibacter mesophilus]|uniref:(2Fe-2S)-binding protein n=1 Tax=Brassicibacter mesophilus TaxID=745119 RepID=UPI003D1FD6D4
MRIQEHPILTYNKGKKVQFTFNGAEYEGYEGETIAAALHAAGVRVLGESLFKHRPRGFFCAIGNCSSCLMVVNGEPNVRTCTTDLEEGMVVETQHGKGSIL